MRLRIISGAVLAISAALLALNVPRANNDLTPGAYAQIDSEAAYDIDVLSGVSSGTLTQTSGWHYQAVDISVAATTEVRAKFRVLKALSEPNTQIIGIVSYIDVGDGTDYLCKRVHINIVQRTTLSGHAIDKLLGELYYLHLHPEVKLRDEIPITSTSNKYLGDIVTPWVESDERTREKEEDKLYDKKGCSTTGPHLHQGGNWKRSTSRIWGNRDKPHTPDDDGLGFDPGGLGYGRPYSFFCADTWIFKIHPLRPAGKTRAEWDPKTTNIAKCGVPPAPAGVEATVGARRIDLSWTNPNNGAISGYLYRIREDTGSYPVGTGTPNVVKVREATGGEPAYYSWSASCEDNTGDTSDARNRLWAWHANKSTLQTRADLWIREYCDWEPISGSGRTTTSHTISTGLKADTKYVVQVRARVGNAISDRGDVATIQATTDGSTPTPTSTPTPPAAPTGLTATEGDRSLELEWDDPGDSSIAGYEYCTNTTAGADCTSWRTMTGATATTTRRMISLLANGSRLMNGTTYYVKIRALNSEGTSEASNEASATPRATRPPPQPIASLTINAATVAGDGTVNKAEKAAGFAIGGSSEAGASVTVTVGTTALSAVTAGSTGSWTVSVPTAASYVSDGRLTISATATRSGFSDGSASATVTVDTVPPSVSYNDVPTELVVDTAVTILPTTTDTDIHSYALTMGSLPSGLAFNAMSGVISDAPSAATTDAVNLTIVVTDRAGNTLAVPLRLPAVTAATTPPVVCQNTLTTTSGSNGRIIPWHPTGQLYDCSERVTVTADPDTDFDVDSWGGDCSGSGGTCTLVMNGPRTASVTFKAEPTLPVVTMGRPTSAPSSVTEGTMIAFRVIRSGSTAASLRVTWSVTQSGNFLSGTPQSAGTIGAGNRGGVFTVDTANDRVDERDGSVTATVTGGSGTYTIGSPPSQTVTVTDNDETLTTSAGENGRIIPRPGDHVYTHGTPVTVTADPDTDFDVDSWGGDCSGSGGTCTLVMNGPRTASVTFKAEPTLPVVTMGRPTSAPSSVTEGTMIAFRVIRSGSTAARLPVTWSVTQSGNFISGTPQTAGTIGAGNRGGIFRVSTANDGVDEPDGSVTATVTGGGSTYTIGTPSSATVTVNDNDEPPTYTVSVSLEEKNNCGGWDCGGSVSVSPSGPYTPNTEITVTASLDYLTFLDEWEMTVGGVTTTHNGETLTFDITGNTTVTGYIRSVCEVMIEVCTLSREEEGGDGEQQSPPP